MSAPLRLPPMPADPASPRPTRDLLSKYRFERDANIFLWCTLCKGLQLAVFGLVFNLYAYALGYDKTFIGLLNAMPAITSLLLAVPAGMLGDRIGPKPLLLVSGFVNPLTLLGMALTGAAPLLILFALCNGAVATLYWVSGTPLLAASTTPERRVQLFSLNSFLLWGAGSLGYALGGGVVALAAGLLGESAHAVGPLRWGMVAVAAVTLLGALPLPWLRAAAPERRPGHERPPYDLALYLRLLGPDVLLTCGGGAVTGFIQLYFALRFGLPAGGIGVFLTVSGLLGGALVLLAPRVAASIGTTRAAIALQAGGVPAVLLLTLAPTQAAAMGAEIARNAFRSMGDPVYNAFAISRVPPEQRSTVAGLYSTTWSVGFAVGPALSGAVQQRAGFTPAFLLGALSMAAGVALLWLFFLRPGAAAAPAEDAGA